MPTLRRPEIPTHVLERQPKDISGSSTETVTPNRLLRGLKRLMPGLVDLPVARGTVFFVTETSPMGYHSLHYKVRESGKLVANHFQPPTGQGCIWTAIPDVVEGGHMRSNGVVEMNTEECRPENQPLMMRWLKEQGLFPVLEDPDFIPGEPVQTNAEAG